MNSKIDYNAIGRLQMTMDDLYQKALRDAMKYADSGEYVDNWSNAYTKFYDKKFPQSVMDEYNITREEADKLRSCWSASDWKGMQEFIDMFERRERLKHSATLDTRDTFKDLLDL